MMLLATGKGGSGKTKYVSRIARRNMIYEDTAIVSNLPFNVTNERLFYYSDLYDLAIVIEPLLEKYDRIIIIMDEAPNLIDSRNWAELSPYFKWLTGQDRHFGVDLYATARHFLKVDVDFRRQMHTVVECDVLRIFGFPLAINTGRREQKRGKIPRGLFITKEYDATEFEKWVETSGTHEMIPEYVDFSVILKADRDFFDTFAKIPFPYVICQTCGHIQRNVCIPCSKVSEVKERRDLRAVSFAHNEVVQMKLPIS